MTLVIDGHVLSGLLAGFLIGMLCGALTLIVLARYWTRPRPDQVSGEST